MEMSNFKNIIGHDGFVWWIGVVEDREDPLNLGRCKVRMFNGHTDNLSELPTKDLPWAQPLHAINSSNTFGTPMEGDWVFGFFSDGLSKQAPVMMGAYPGIPQKNVDSDRAKGFSANAKYSNRTVAEVQAATANTRPVPYSTQPAMKLVREGQPSVPATSYTYKGTGIEYSDNNRAHVCDVANNLRLQNALNEFKNTLLYRQVRNAIEAITESSAASPMATQLTQAVKSLRAIVREIQKFLTFINDVVLEISKCLAIIRAMIAWIQSLPAQLLAMLKDCLEQLISSISNALSISGSGSSNDSLLSNIRALYNDVSSAAGTAIQINANAQNVVAQTSNLLDPKSYGRA